MFTTFAELKDFCGKEGIQLIDFKVVDMAGRWHHLTIPVEQLTEKTISRGIGMDGSSYGFLTVEKSDMAFKPDMSTAFVDPFSEIPMISIMADIYTLGEGAGRFEGDPRYVAQKTEEYIAKLGIADTCLLGPEFEFYILDHISFRNDVNHLEVNVDSRQAAWNTGKRDEPNLGYHVGLHGGYHVDLPKDSSFDLRNEMILMLDKHGVPVKYHHSENGGPGQVEIEVEFGTLTTMADRSMLLKYIVKNLALKRGRTVTFMPKPFYGELGSGMHAHIQFFNEGKPVFFGEGYSGLSDIALYAIGGILKHARSLCAFTNPSTNSYKRLVPHFEAPVKLAYSARNRSASIRIPYVSNPKARRIETRFPDPMANPYLAFSALMMAGLDGIQNKIHPGDAMDKDLYDLPKEEALSIPTVCHSLEQALDYLERDHAFLTKGGVFTEDMIQAYIELKRKDVERLNMTVHPAEFDMYYSL